MPYGLFDYIPDSPIHTMGAAGDKKTVNGVEYVQCKNGMWDATRGFVAPCLEDSRPPPQPRPPVNCPMDMMHCPDGSVLSRSGPNCTFPACPMPKPKCPPTYTSGGCNYRLV